ncbi:MAG: hypothetical protein IRY95_02025 [Clostridia bacterium]|nr:hypothetical protein [Clostridia bacterium]
MADLLDLHGDDGGRAAAYRRAASALARRAADVADLWAQGRLTEIPGIGGALAGKVGEVFQRGSFAALDRLVAATPAGVLELLQIPGIGPRTAGRLWRELGAVSPESAAEAVRAGRLVGLPGFGERRAEQVARALEAYLQRKAARRRHPLARALGVALALQEDLRRRPGVEATALAGSVRRGCELVGDVDLVVAATDPVAWALALARDERVAGEPRPWPEGVDAAAGDPVGWALTLSRTGGHGTWSIAADVVVVPREVFGAALFLATGAPAHCERVRSFLGAAGWSWQGLALRHSSPVTGGDGARSSSPGADGPGAERLAATEEDVYAAAGLTWIPPELREDTGEVEASAAGCLPVLLTRRDLRGDLHVHSDWSDGRESIEAMLRAAAERGHRYLGLADHSASLAVARGMDAGRLRLQAAAVVAARRAVPRCHLFHGAEVDILRDGTLDYSDDDLAHLDHVVASVHRHLEQDADTMTARLVKAIRSGRVDVIGHPTGRLLGHRPPYDLDFDAVVAAAAQCGVALEINASPDRLDLPPELARRAARAGVAIVVDTDAHASDGLDDLDLGVTVARRAWLEPRHVLNAQPLEEVRAWLDGRRRRFWQRPAPEAASRPAGDPSGRFADHPS